MDHSQFLDDDVTAQIDWDNFFQDLPENLFDFDSIPVSDSPAVSESPPSSTSTPDAFSNPSPGSVSSWIDEIEGLLMNDGAGNDVGSEDPSVVLCENFLADVLGDSTPPPGDGGSDEVVDARNDTSDSDVGSGGPEKEKVGVAEDNDETVEDADDPASKKRRRQLRNRDAAVKSRERKKLYVRDLEVKSKYLEGECRRLGRLLQCFMAENHALRLTLQNGSVATMTKQESAVLLLESLLLGSLLWFLGLTCLFTLEGVPQGNVEKKSLASQAPREPRSKTFGSLVLPCFLRSRRCRASRTRMRLNFISRHLELKEIKKETKLVEDLNDRAYQYCSPVLIRAIFVYLLWI